MSEHLLDFLCEPERYELDGSALFWEVSRRRFFQIVGGGIVVACLFGDELLAQDRPQRRQRGGGSPPPPEIGAWIHIGEDSLVTVYTGKVEIGQNIRTSLSQVVAEELHAPLAQIHLVMADTQLVPFDFGTAGSRTTPAMAVQLRRVAAAAREALIDLAAEQSKIDRNQLSVADGKVAGPDGKPSIAFGQLTKGKKLMKLVVPTSSNKNWAISGTSTAKVDGHSFVTGAHRYASDTVRPSMLHGKVLRPPAFKATLLSVDVKKAESIPGVTVFHDKDFVGVTAPTEFEAAKALAAIHAEWKTMPQPSARELFDYLKSHPATGGRGGGEGGRSQNEAGSVANGLATASIQLSATYTIAYIAHCPLEPRATVAEWSDGKLTVWTGTQMPFGVRAELARTFNLQPEQVRVIVPDMGSGYGGKHTAESAVEAARLAKAAGKPVKLVWTREEEFTWAYFRPAGVIEVNAGAMKDGTLVAWEMHNYNSGGSALKTPYEVANQRHQFHSADSPLRQGSYRALAATANHFARESHMDDLARSAHMDPLAFRLKNLKDERLRAVLESAAKQFGWQDAKPASGVGFGIAAGTEKGSYVASCAEVSADRKTGRVKVRRIASAFECGAVLNPDHLKNQIEGAAMMGLGGALFEAIQFADGKILNPRFSAYRVPRFQDAPVIEAVVVNRKDLPSAGAGETPIVAIAPAIGNAILNATGIRLRSLPMVPNGLS
jgi:isoquinoline 1-oxidoreductase